MTSGQRRATAVRRREQAGRDPQRPLEQLLVEVRACRLCEGSLPLGPRPVLRASVTARLLIVGQAPGTRVHETGIPWNDPSGDRLRDWLAVDRDTFYDQSRIAIVPTGLCYPGRKGAGDAPPRPECAPRWHPPLLAAMPRIELVLLVGQYAQAFYLGARRKATLAATVRAHEEYEPRFLPLPHPSPRNKLWLRRNAWFEAEVVPHLRRRVAPLL
jgi:uracil-DNA glycosylase